MSAVDIPLAGEAETPHTAPARLVVEHASFAYDPARRDAPHFSLEPVSFQARRGEMVMIVGPNASGKTTLLRLLSGVLRPLGGRVELDGAEVARLDPRTRAQRIAMVQQESPLVFPVHAAEYVLQGRYPYSRRLHFPKEEDQEMAMRALDPSEDAGQRAEVLSVIAGGRGDEPPSDAPHDPAGPGVDQGLIGQRHAAPHAGAPPPLLVVAGRHHLLAGRVGVGCGRVPALFQEESPPPPYLG